jgi:GNAT superfamily N-acetyltransferase
MAPTFTAAPLTIDTWEDFERLTTAPGSTILSRCWCVAYRCHDVDTNPAGAAANRRLLRALVDARRPAGMLGYLDDEPVAYLSLGPREDYAPLQTSRTMGPVDDTPVWSIVCTFVVPRRRGQGIQRRLLAATIDYARSNGVRVLESYPIDKPERSSNASLWFGARSLYEKAGFREVARRSATRVVMRRTLRPPTTSVRDSADRR